MYVVGQDEETSQLFACLRIMFERASDFGGGLFALAASVMTDLIHHDPLCFRSLDDAGLPEAFINAVQVTLLHSTAAQVDSSPMLLLLSTHAWLFEQ